jgi:transcription antitermination factor NusG
VVESYTKAELQCGGRVRVTAGPLSGLEGVLVRNKNPWKLLLSVEMLGRLVAVEVDAKIVKRVYVPKL